MLEVSLKIVALIVRNLQK